MKVFRHTWREKLVYLLSMILSKLINGNTDLTNITPKHILCIREDEIGDMCYSLHVFDMLKKQFPDAKLTLLCKPFAITLLNNNPTLNHLTSNYKDLTHKYDLIIDLRGSFRSILFSITHWPKARIDRGTVRFTNSKLGKHPHEVLTNLQIISPIIEAVNQNTTPRIYTSKQDKKKIEDFLIAHQIVDFAILHIGARKYLRKWNKYAALANCLSFEKKLAIVFIGDNSEVIEVKALQKTLTVKTYNAAGIFNLTELAALCAKANLYVGNESGPLHIASLSGAPTLGLYGPGEPYVFYPWGKKTAVLHPILPCNPCNQIDCVHADNPCINRIELADALAKIALLLS